MRCVIYRRFFILEIQTLARLGSDELFLQWKFLRNRLTMHRIHSSQIVFIRNGRCSLFNFSRHTYLKFNEHKRTITIRNSSWREVISPRWQRGTWSWGPNLPPLKRLPIISIFNFTRFFPSLYHICVLKSHSPPAYLLSAKSLHYMNM